MTQSTDALRLASMKIWGSNETPPSLEEIETAERELRSYENLTLICETALLKGRPGLVSQKWELASHLSLDQHSWEHFLAQIFEAIGAARNSDRANKVRDPDHHWAAALFWSNNQVGAILLIFSERSPLRQYAAQLAKVLEATYNGTAQINGHQLVWRLR